MNISAGPGLPARLYLLIELKSIINRSVDVMKKIKLFPFSWNPGLLLLPVVLLLLINGCDKTDHIERPGNETEEEPEEKDTSDTAIWLVKDSTQNLGVNFNGQFDFIDYANLSETNTEWVRGFIDFFQFYNNQERLQTDVRLQKYLTLKDNGYQTILNIKWDFKNNNLSLPSPDTPEILGYFRFLRKILDQVWDETDLLVVGNEPFIETPVDERDERLVLFYEQVAKVVHQYGENHDKNLPIFLGAINNLHVKTLRTDAAIKLLKLVKETSWIAGIDLHIHHGAIEQITENLDYVSRRIRNDQKILVSEFSLMRHFKSKLTEKIPLSFAQKYGRDVDEKNFQFIDYALKNPVSRTQWVDFLSSSYWFENRKHYLANAYDRLSNYPQFYVATYAFRQSFPYNQDFTAQTLPFVLNGLYANRTVELNPSDGRIQFNYAFIQDFRKIQNQ